MFSTNHSFIFILTNSTCNFLYQIYSKSLADKQNARAKTSAVHVLTRARVHITYLIPSRTVSFLRPLPSIANIMTQFFLACQFQHLSTLTYWVLHRLHRAKGTSHTGTYLYPPPPPPPPPPSSLG